MLLGLEVIGMTEYSGVLYVFFLRFGSLLVWSTGESSRMDVIVDTVCKEVFILLVLIRRWSIHE